MSSSKRRSSGGTSGITIIYGIVQAVLIIMKILNQIDWTWMQVFRPTFVYVGITVVFIILIILIEVFFD